MKQLNSVRFIEDKDVHEIVARWLEPARRRGPVLALHFGFTHWHEWIVIAFPKGLSREASVQQFLFGGEGDQGLEQRFDRVDRHGRMFIEETTYDGDKKETRFYRWDGFDFADRTAPYFVIAASVKSRAQAAAFVRQHKLEAEAQIRPSRHYAKLRPGYFIVILGRYQRRSAATERATAYRKVGLTPYVKRAF